MPLKSAPLKFLLFSIWVTNSANKIHADEAQTFDGHTGHNESLHPRHRRSIPSVAEAKLVLDTHNEFRSIIGNEGEEPIPSNMRHLTWDDGLAYTALTYAKQCIWKHSEYGARKTSSLNSINGENLWSGGGDLAVNFDPAYGITSWFNEYKDYDFYNRTCTPGKKCGHYTQIVWATTYKLGCAWTLCPKLKMVKENIIEENMMYMVCHYAPTGNVGSRHLYKVGPRCTECNSFDSCPDNALCHNEKRDKVIPFVSNASTLAGSLAGTVIILATVGAVAYFIYVNYQSKATSLIGGFRKSRRVSSSVGLNDSRNTTSSMKESVTEDDLSSIKENCAMENIKIRGARLSSVQIVTSGLPD